MTSKEAFELIFGNLQDKEAEFKIWQIAVNWERRDVEDIAKRYKQRNSNNYARKCAAESIIQSIKRRDKNDRSDS